MFHNAAKAILLAVLLSACSSTTVPVRDDPDITLTPCVLTTRGSDTQVDARCSSLKVAEEPSNPDSRQIELNIAVVEAVRRNAEPDPLFFLVGGPGQSAIEIFAAAYPAFFEIHQDRDIVLVDQRGTGKSNPLRCLDPGEEALEEAEATARLKECPQTLDADPRFYTTDIAMQDLDKVRDALGYETINLYGVSYGTRAALVYLKMHPRRVRSMILDAVVDPSFVLYQHAALDGQRSLDLFFDRCEADPDCSSTYPRLRSEFEQVLQKLEASPAEITISHPVTGRPLDVTLTGALVTSHVFNMLYSPDLVAVLPFVIHQAYDAQNYAPLITQGYLVDAGVYDGMFYAVGCAEDSSLIEREKAVDGIFGENVQKFLEICQAWPQQEPPGIIHEPVASDVPVLMLSGEADPITPPWHAELLRGTLANSLHVIFPGMGHGNGISDCGRRIMKDFIETGSTAGLDVTCAEKVQPPPFFVDFSGPRP